MAEPKQRPSRPGVSRALTPGPEKSDHSQRGVCVFDCRPKSTEATGRVIDIRNLDYNGFLKAVSKEFSIARNETFVLTTTDRREIGTDIFDQLEDGKTLHLLHSVDQVLPMATQERIEYLPHYHTLVQSGMYEYYASEGQKSLPYAFAELIDNALSATADNTGVRTIDIRLLFDESQGKPAVVVLDNGRGMTSKQLNNWAVYRLSKFTRDNGTFQSDHTGYSRPNPVPRSLNSDISYFGVGGKQAVFYIGQSVRMISKPAGSPDVHEFVMSKEDFERKEKNKEEIYSGVILNRNPGVWSHVNSAEEPFLQSLIQEEVGKESFTAVVITGIQPEHITYLKQHFSMWTRELAHIYHYYVHGVTGNDLRDPSGKSPSNIDIQISLVEKSPRLPRLVNLREVDNDMQTLYVSSSVAVFEFKASAEGDAAVEGLLRYHPFLYDRETYPEDPYAMPGPADDDDEECVVLNAEGRGKRPIFECFWNGRLIPYTTVSEFEWCARPKKGASVPLECYNRISGVLFANDRFQVSTNKLTFMDLELKLKDKETIFTRVVNGQEQRVKIQREFVAWLKDCHEHFDKQVKFMGFQGVTSRSDVTTKRLQSPWACFRAIRWDGKTFKSGDYVKSVKTQPILFGSIVQFLLYGHHEGDVYATGGHVQISMEPKELYDEVRIIPITKIDRQVSTAAIKRNIEEELAKLPVKLEISWPEGNPWPENSARPAGTLMGPIKVEILNKKGESMSRLPVANNSAARKLLIDLKVIWHSPKGDVQTNSHIAMYSSKWDYWFKKMENLTKLGKYTLRLQTILNENNSSEWAGKCLPHYTLNFTITEGNAEAFVLGVVPTPVHVGVPFSLSLEFRDEFGHLAQPPSDIKPQLECSSLEVTSEKTAVKGTTFTIKDIRMRGTVKNHLNKTHTLKVVIPGLKQDSQTTELNVHPGLPHTLVVLPDDDVVTIENGTPVGFRVEVRDESSNVTTHSKLIVRCQLQGLPDLLVDAVDCSNTGSGQLFGKPVQVNNIKEEKILTAKFDIPSQQAVACVERTLRVLPSTRVSRIEVHRRDDGSDDVMVLQNLERIDWTAGDTLGSLCYRLFDEGNRLVPITPKLAPKIKVNWTASMKVAELAQGQLPSVCVPTLVQGEHFYQVSFQDQFTVNTSFIIVPRADEPDRLRVSLCESTVRMGDTLSGNIYVDVVDQYGNKTDTLNAENMKNVSVSADGLDTATLTMEWQESGSCVLVHGVRFMRGSPGQRDLCFKYQGFEEFARIKVTAGQPTTITLLDPPELPLQVLNGHGLDTPFVLQLSDEWGNPSPDQRVIIAMRTRSPQLKIKSSVMSRPVDSDGRACFMLETVTAPKGQYELEFRGSFSKSSIAGPVVKLNVIPDPNKPVKLTIEYDSKAMLPAGGTLTDFKVTVLSEEGGIVPNINPANISMLLWKGSSTGSRPPQGATTLRCSKPKDTEKDDCFYFRDKAIPERVGKYTVQFVLCLDKTKALWSHQYELNVVHGKPVKLVPDTPPSTPVVSNSNTLASRTLVESLCLKIMDDYNNPAGEGIDGHVVVTVRSCGGGRVRDLPVFEGKTSSRRYTLTNGEALITGLALMENSPGIDGGEYILDFSLDIPRFEPRISLAPFLLPFRFYNDVENQKIMATLSKRKDRLSQSIDIYRELFDTNKQLIHELQNQVHNAGQKEAQLEADLRMNDLDITQLTSESAVKAVISQKQAALERIKSQPRRKCTMPDPFRGSPNVLGKIAHLALVEDDDVAKVISWHLLGDMDCVVTVTTAAARRIYDDTQGRQQVIPLETVFWRPSNRPLPHIRNGVNLFHPVGNPVFVRDLLIFPKHAENCNMVFSSLLGDTILMDDLDSANEYRKRVVQSKVQCPTLLTRQGDRIRSNGKFGGLQNKAPPIEKLRGQVFGAPLPKEYHTIQKHIELLQQYCLARQKAGEVKSEYDCHVLYMQSPEMRKKEQELHQQEAQLRDIEKTLASTPVRVSPGSTIKRPAAETDESAHTPSKRARRKARRLQGRQLPE
ncbi:structural maintenance of chromosomes flexible hinge domain-containing protein 1 [Chanos chanos]|uniref:Structural maintenance of chromosomes flexible hinge domain-containing protein 1 n=1 Tax=Chanos chanos TaxID=29144 RepID=A0A6J2VSH3_CHACN|nr:structural maintenance of chromosomes flexible hinge domain-containing protein 1 [Chanos chanos]